MGRIIKKIQNKQYGQAMAEFALTIPIFLLLIFGIIELSRFFLVYSSVYTASREASRYGSSVGQIGNENYLNCQGIIDMAINSGWFGGVAADDITIYYESTPGNIIGSCYDRGTGLEALEGNCYDGSTTCDISTSIINPELGDRLLVEIDSEFTPLLGLIPEMPVRATNGRTIMKAISIEQDPEPFEMCVDHVGYINPTPQTDSSNDNVLFVSIENLESDDQDPNTPYQTSFSIFAISDINWTYKDIPNQLPKLLEIRWGDSDFASAAIIWKSKNVEGDIPIISIPGGENYWEEYSRNLTPNDTFKLFFVFTEEVVQDDIELNFELIMQHNNLPTDFCWPVD